MLLHFEPMTFEEANAAFPEFTGQSASALCFELFKDKSPYGFYVVKPLDKNPKVAEISAYVDNKRRHELTKSLLVEALYFPKILGFLSILVSTNIKSFANVLHSLIKKYFLPGLQYIEKSFDYEWFVIDYQSEVAT